MKPTRSKTPHQPLALLLALALLVCPAHGQSASEESPPPVTLTSQEDLTRLCELLHVEPILKRPSYNYDESKADPFPTLPDPLLLKDGTKVTDAKTWWEKRRPE